MYKTFASTLLVLALLGCAAQPSPQNSSRVYSEEASLRLGKVQTGTVISVREVAIRNNRSGVGAVTGAVAGGALGSNVGKGNGRTVMMGLGALIGAAAGASAENEAQTIPAVEIIIELKSGRKIAVTQSDDELILKGQEVAVIRRGDVYRVSPL